MSLAGTLVGRWWGLWWGEGGRTVVRGASSSLSPLIGLHYLHYHRFLFLLLAFSFLPVFSGRSHFTSSHPPPPPFLTISSIIYSQTDSNYANTPAIMSTALTTVFTCTQRLKLEWLCLNPFKHRRLFTATLKKLCRCITHRYYIYLMGAWK